MIARKKKLSGCLIIVALLAGCSDGPSSPRLEPAYDPTELTNGLLYRWPTSATVRFHVSSPARMPVAGSTTSVATLVNNALAAWRPAAARGEVRTTVTERLDDADVVIYLADEQSPVNRQVCPFPPGSGAAVTTFCFQGDTAVTLPLLASATGRVKVSIRVDPARAATAAALQSFLAHEVGHSLGIGGHSPERTDLMSIFADAPRPTDRDLATLRYVLRQRADVEF